MEAIYADSTPVMKVLGKGTQKKKKKRHNSKVNQDEQKLVAD